MSTSALLADPSAALQLTFAVTAAPPSLRRFPALAVHVRWRGRHLAATELVAGLVPCAFVRPVVLPPRVWAAPELRIELHADGVAAAGITADLAALIVSSVDGRVVLPLGSSKLELYFERFDKACAAHVAHFKLASRGFVNGTRPSGPVQLCSVVVSRQRQADTSWAPVYRSRSGVRVQGAQNDVGGALHAFGLDDCSDAAVRIEAYMVRPWKSTRFIGSIHVSLEYLLEQQPGALLPLTSQDGQRAGYCAIRKSNVGKCESHLTLDAFFFGAPASAEHGLVMPTIPLDTTPAFPKVVFDEDIQQFAARRVTTTSMSTGEPKLSTFYVSRRKSLLNLTPPSSSATPKAKPKAKSRFVTIATLRKLTSEAKPAMFPRRRSTLRPARTARFTFRKRASTAFF